MRDPSERRREAVFVPGDGPTPPAAEIGGKARNLTLLFEAGFDVPPFLVATVGFFEAFAGEELARAEGALAGVREPGDPALAAAAAAAQAALGRRPIPGALARALSDALGAALGPAPGLLAVRSSAVDEDSVHHSFAGLLDSHLFVAPGDELLDAVRSCFASAFNPRVLHYRLANGLPLVPVRAAVVVQRMVAGDVSGIAFTGNPVTRIAEEMVIEAAPGLGEGIVSGAVEPDSWVLGERGEISGFTPGEKRTMVVLDRASGRGTTTVPVEEAARRAPCLSDAQVGAVAALARRVEDLHGGVPQDVEWTLAGGRLWLLQARPVTVMAHVSKRLPRTILDNSNIIESYSGVTSPLTFSFASAVYTEAFLALYRFLGVSPARLDALAEDFRNLLVHHRGRVYYRLNGWYAALSLLPGYEVHKENLDLSLGVSASAEVPGALPRAGRRLLELLCAGRVAARIGWLYLRRAALVRRFSETFEREAGPLLHEDFAGRTNRELLAIYERLRQRLVRAWAVPLFNDFLTETFFGALARTVRWCGVEDAQNLQNDLLCGQGGILSLRPTTELLAIARWAGEHPELRARFARADDDAALAAEVMSATAGPALALRERLEPYLREYGYRCADELKLEEPPLRDDPTFLFAMLRNYLARPAADPGASREREGAVRARAEARAFAHLRGWRRPAFAWVLRNARERIRAREDLRFARTRLFGVVRNLMRALGRNLARDGVLAAADDVFFLTQPELWELVELRSSSAGIVRELVRLRREEASRHGRAPAPERIVYYGDLTAGRFLEVAAARRGDSAPGAALRGVGCSPGTARAPARVLGTPDGARLQGEILVTERTDPGWVPLFPCASGLVIERGSVLSHSAVVARELGIPTVVGARDATRLIQDGEVIVVDGTAGTVAREPPP